MLEVLFESLNCPYYLKYKYYVCLEKITDLVSGIGTASATHYMGLNLDSFLSVNVGSIEINHQ
jgi:hypothetical protein